MAQSPIDMVPQDKVVFNGTPEALEKLIPQLESELWPDRRTVHFDISKEQRDKPLLIKFGKPSDLPQRGAVYLAGGSRPRYHLLHGMAVPMADEPVDWGPVQARSRPLPPRYAEITAYARPQGKAELIVRAGGPWWPALAPFWEQLKAVLIERTWIEPPPKEDTAHIESSPQKDVNRLALAQEVNERKAANTKLTFKSIVHKIRLDYGWPPSDGESDIKMVYYARLDLERVVQDKDVGMLKEIANRRAEVVAARKAKKEKN